MKNSKINTDNIDEEFLLSTFRDTEIDPAKKTAARKPDPKESEEVVRADTQEPEPAQRGTKKEYSRKNDTLKLSDMNEEDYINLFIQESEVVARQGKSVNIRTEYHNYIQKIIQTIGKNSISISSFIDNVLKYHFETCEDLIDGLYKKNLSNKLFNNKK
jgi:tRNA U34 5-carboxymethylaminomethyl modifying enzyme MnmG/GidA